MTFVSWCECRAWGGGWTLNTYYAFLLLKPVSLLCVCVCGGGGGMKACPSPPTRPPPPPYTLKCTHGCRLCVTKASGEGADSVFMGVFKYYEQDHGQVRAYVSPGVCACMCVNMCMCVYNSQVRVCVSHGVCVCECVCSRAHAACAPSCPMVCSHRLSSQMDIADDTADVF